MTAIEDPIPCDGRRVAVWGEPYPGAAVFASEESGLQSVLPLANVLVAPARPLLRVSSVHWPDGYAIVALTGPGRGFLEEQDVDQLWKIFGVPVFERLLDEAGNVVATECEAHDGLHVTFDPACWTITNDVLTVNGKPLVSVRECGNVTCGCGLDGFRIHRVNSIVAALAA